jgi:uncharacterized membrane protein
LSTSAQPASGPAPEAVWTVVIGFLLGTLGFVSYTGGVPYFGTGHSASFTPWIPSWVGTPLMLLGLLAMKDRYLKHAMHAAAMIGLLGLIAALVPLGIKASKGNWDERPEATHSEVAMVVLCGVFVVVCVRSFIAARRRRKLREAGGAV